MENQKNRRLAAVMFTDIVGYTALMQKDEATAAQLRTRHRQVFEQFHQVYHGEILQYFGDGTLSVFQSGVEAVECALALQTALQVGTVVPLRIGLHMGDIVFDGTEIYGDGVNFASRIESMGTAGAILLSDKLNDELKNQGQISTQSLGHFELKNVSRPVEIFAVSNAGIVVPPLSAMQGKGKRKVQEKTIAVLPFINMSASEEQEYFSDGMTEEIINALAKIKNLKVTSRTSSFFFKNKNIPIPQIGQKLKVSTILEGSIRLAGNKMRITAQLIDVENDFHFWSETFDRSMEDIFAVQDEISLLIADKLREHLGHFDIEEQLVPPRQIPVETYKRYLKGRYYLMKLTLADTQKSIEIFKEIIAEQADFILPYLDINQGYSFLGTMGVLPAAEAFAKAKPFLDKAIELDENSAEVQLNLAWIACWQHWDFPRTYQHLIKALEIRPSYNIYLTMANTLAVEGKFEASLTYVDQALQLDPLAAMNHHFKGFIYYLKEKYEAALPHFQKSLELQAGLGYPLLYTGLTFLLMDRAEEGLAYFQTLPEDQPGEFNKLGGSTLAYAALGDLPNAEAGLGQLQAALRTEAMGSALYLLIQCFSILGRREEAMEYVEQGIGYRLPNMLLLYTDPMVKVLRSEPRFQTLMQQIFGDQATIDLSPRKYKKSLFDEKILHQYKQQLESLMQEQQPFLDSNLSLRSLAQLLDMPPNHLSQLLNEGFDKNFAEFVNTFRLETFKSKLADPQQQHLTLLALAYDSGFNSKTVFNTFFKKMEGMTPKAYQKQLSA